MAPTTHELGDDRRLLICTSEGGLAGYSSLLATPTFAAADRDLRTLVAGLTQEAVQVDAVRNDVPAEELATYSVNAAWGARQLRSHAAVHRLTKLTLAALKP